VKNLRRYLKNYEDQARPFGELLPWMLLVGESGELVLQKDGSLLACFAYQGVDQEGKMQFEIDHYANLIEHALRSSSFDEQITLWWTMERRRTREFPKGEFPDPVSAGINGFWEDEFKSGNHYSNKNYVSVLFTPKAGTDGLMDQFNYFHNTAGYSFPRAIYEAGKNALFKGNAFSYTQAQFDEYIAIFNSMLQSFDSTLADIGMKRLYDESLLSFLHDRCSPATARQPVRLPKIPVYLDGYLSSNMAEVGKNTIKFTGGGTVSHVRAMGVKDWPEWSQPGLIDGVSSIAGEVTLSQCFRIMEHDQARKYIDDSERHQRSLQIPLRSHIKKALTKEGSSQINEDRVALADDASDAKMSLGTGGRKFGFYNMTVLAHGSTESECKSTHEELSKYFRLAGFITVDESLHLLSAWAGTLPGQWAEVVRWYFVSGGNMADLATPRTLWSGEHTNPYLSEQLKQEMPALTVLSTAQSTPFYFNLFQSSGVGHALMIGPTGTGKSVFNNFLISQFRKYTPCNIFIFDKDYSCRISTLLQDGNYIDIAGEMGGEVRLNPMLLIGDKCHWEWLKGWLEALMVSRGYQWKTDDDNELWRAMENVAAQPATDWQLKSLYNFLPLRLAEELSPWVNDGPMARYFDNSADSFSLGQFNGMEIGGIFKNPRLATAFLDYAFYRISLMLNGRPTLIYIEEAWFMLADEAFANKIDDWLRTFRKKMAAVLLATQSLTEISESPIFATLIDNIPTKIFLPNANALAHRDLYAGKFGLNETQIMQIRSGIPKSNYYIVTPEVSRMVHVAFPEDVLNCVRSDARAQQLFTRLYKKSENWKYQYLEEIQNAH